MRIRTISAMTMRPKPIKQPITVDDLPGLTSNTWDNAWINKLWIRKLVSNPTVFQSGSGTIYHTQYRTWVNLTHIHAWVPGVYEVTMKANGGGGGGADTFYSRDGEGGDGAVGETTTVRGWRLHTGSAGLYQVRLPNRGVQGATEGPGFAATDGGSGGQRRVGTINDAEHFGGRGADAFIGGTGYDKTPTGNGGEGGTSGAHPTNFGQPGGWGYTKIQLIG